MILQQIYMKTSLVKIAVMAFTLLLAMPSFGQEDEDFIHVYGAIKDYQTRRKISGVDVIVKQDGKAFKTITTTANGKFEFFLPLDHIYNIEYQKSNYVSKNIEIDSRNVPEEQRAGGFSMNTDVEIFESVPDVDFSFLENPIGKANWDESRGGINWNFDYIESVKNQIERLMKEYEKAKKEDDKEEETANKEEEQRNLKFEKLMKDGGTALASKKYDEAIAKYQEAVALKGDNETAKSKLEEARSLKADQEAVAEANKKFNEFLDKGDDAMKAKNYEDAINYYQSALSVKEGEKYPKDQIAQAEKLMEELAKQQAEQKAFDDLISQGESNLEKNEFDDAIENFEKALEINPLDREVKSKIQDAKAKKEDYLANKEKEEQYAAVILEADGLFEQEKYQDAIAKYKEAQKIKANEEYPDERIKEAESKIEEVAQKEKEAEELAQKEEEYNQFMTEGNRNFSDKKFNEAIANFKDALKVKEGDTEALSKLDEAQVQKEEMEASMAKQDRFDSMVKSAQELFDEKDYESSLSAFKEADTVISNELTQSKIKEIEQILKEEQEKEEQEKALAEEKERQEKELADKEEQFASILKEADLAENNEDYQEAINLYKQALDIFPEDRKVQSKIESAERKLKEANEALAEAEKLRLEEEARTAEEERIRQEEEEQKRLEEEEANRIAEEAKELEDRYLKVLETADDLFSEKNYDLAVDEYEKALEIKEDADYPSKQIARINELKEKREQDRLAEEKMAEKRRQREEELARQKELQEKKFSSDLEKEAEDYIAQLREERRKKKIEQSKNIKNDWKSNQEEYQKTSEDLISQNKEDIQGIKNEFSEREEKFREVHKERVGSMHNFKEDVQEFNSANADLQEERIKEAKKEENLIFAEYNKELQEKGEENIEDNLESVADLKEVSRDVSESGKRVQKNSWESSATEKKVYARHNERYSSEGSKKIKDANHGVVQQKKEISTFNAGRAEEVKDKTSRKIESEKRNAQKFNERKSSDQDERLKTNREKAFEMQRHNTEPQPDQFERNPLADTYPQGITEEKEVENGKVVLTRYKVVGNKVDVYKKVMGLNTSFFFKNGVSCTQGTWDRESTVVLE
ncbi:MAG: hypothetical protein AAF487_10065 [Bacteroidota bacterium]